MPKQPKEKKELVHTPKGMRDILPSEVAVWERIETKAKEIAEFYGFLPIRTPHVEHADIFLHTLGDATDIVEKQMYTFRTRGKDVLALRPEGTASLMRAYIQHGMRTWTQPVMLYYSGSFFRHERPQKGRWREFGQFGFEVLGADGAVADALVIRLSVLMLEELGIGPLRVHVNTLGDSECRAEYKKELIAYFRKKVNYLCKDCRRRLKINPLRILDCVEEKCHELAKDAPQLIEYVCSDCKTHFREVIEFLDKVGIPYFLDHRLVRGLDYYSRTVFEIFLEEKRGSVKTDDKQKSEEKDKEDSEVKREQDEDDSSRMVALASGGRYDTLAYALGMKEPKDPETEAQWKGAVGSALGIDRIAEELMKKQQKKDASFFFLIQLGSQAKQQSLILLEQFRKNRLPIGSSLSKDSINQQLSYASHLGVSFSIILGQKETIDQTVIVRDMETGLQETVPQAKLLDYLKKKKKNK
ncbi:MAG: histidine--tRNA ligase [Candidatus Niyogibacteria bacterium]|nr:histidine--tRNA ligase [Candidatus Niyogibacteria bacterium]